jgi:hypothetical protein
MVTSRVEDDAVEPREERFVAGDLFGPIDLDEHFLHGVVDLLTEPLEVEDAPHLGRVPPEELGARLGLPPSQAVDQTVRQFLYCLPPR